MQIRIEDASYPQLIEVAKLLQLDVKYGVTRGDELRQLVRDAMPGAEYVEVPEAEKAAPVVGYAPDAVKSPGDSTHHSHDPKVTINIASDEANGGSHPFPISNNGAQILVMRDTDVAIPYRHYLVLKDAVETVLEPYIDGQGVPQVREHQQYAVRFNVTNMPSAAEIEAFHMRTRNIRAGGQRKAA